MAAAIVGVLGALLGVAIGVFGQEVQARRNRESQREDLVTNHRWQQEDLLRNTKRLVYTQYLRSIDASYAQATSGKTDRSEDANIDAAAAEIELLASKEVSEPARNLGSKVIDTHSRIAVDAALINVLVPECDRHRYDLIKLFKADLGIQTKRQAARGDAGEA